MINSYTLTQIILMGVCPYCSTLLIERKINFLFNRLKERIQEKKLKKKEKEEKRRKKNSKYLFILEHRLIRFLNIK